MFKKYGVFCLPLILLLGIGVAFTFFFNPEEKDEGQQQLSSPFSNTATLNEKNESLPVIETDPPPEDKAEQLVVNEVNEAQPLQLVELPSLPSVDGKAISETESEARLVVTSNFGEKSLFDQKVKITSDTDILQLLKANLTVETTYGGYFINSINGLISDYTGKKQGEKNDWFLYVNGVMAAAGAQDIMVQPGDVIWWDYHNWNNNFITPAMIGAFPQPFKQPFVLLYSSSLKEQSLIWSQMLGEKKLDFVVEELSEAKLDRRKTPVLLIALVADIESSPALEAWLDNYSYTGNFCKVNDTGFIPLDANGRMTGLAYEQGSGILVATGSGLGDKTPLWLAMAYDESGLEKLYQLMAASTIPSQGGWGWLVHESGWLRLPV